MTEVEKLLLFYQTNDFLDQNFLKQKFYIKQTMF